MKLKAIGTNIAIGSGAGLIGLFSSVAHADLPTLAPPSRGGATDNLVEFIQNYAYDFVVFAGLLLAVVAFFMVAASTLRAYGSVSDGRGSMGQVAVQGGVGVLLILIIVGLITLAVEIL